VYDAFVSANTNGFAAPRARDNEHTDLRSTKGDEIAAEHDVGLVFIDADEKVYLSITARGYLGQDRVKAAAIWKTSDKMWWKGPDDPNVACCERRCQPQKCGMAQQAEPSPCSSL
jgi:general stress protein 26